jgi:hypothetical protein
MRHDPTQGGLSAALHSQSAGLGNSAGDAAVVLPGVRSPGTRSRVLHLHLTVSRPIYGFLALGALIAGCLAVVVFAAAEPSVLVPRSRFAFPGWLAGPFHGVFAPLRISPQTMGYGFSAVILAMTLAYGFALASVRLLSMRAIVIAVVALHAVLLLSPPLQLTDLFNYLGYARLGALHHLNPYTHVIANERHDPAWALTTWYNLHSPYGPVFTLFTYPLALAPLSVAYWSLKTATVLASLGFLALVWRCARQLGHDPRFAVLFVAANPIFLIYELGGFHNDVFMLIPALAAISLLLDGRDRRAGAALALAVAVKFTAVLLLPFLLLAARPARRQARLLTGMVLAAVPLAAASIAAFGLTIPNLSDQSSLLTSFSVPNLVGLVLGQGGGTPTLVRLGSVALIVVVVLLLWRRGDWLTGAGWSTLALVCSLAWLVPWYIVWVLPLAGLGKSVRLRRATLAFSVFLVLSFIPATSLVMSKLKLSTMNGAASQASLTRQLKLEH